MFIPDLYFVIQVQKVSYGGDSGMVMACVKFVVKCVVKCVVN